VWDLSASTILYLPVEAVGGLPPVGDTHARKLVASGRADGITCLSAMDAYLLCSGCADLLINELVNKPVHVVSLYFPRLVLE
jgi:acetamidase/formamidase